MTEKRLQDALYHFRNKHRHTYIVPNAVMSWGEVDLLTVTPAGLVIEHEIKISRGDFKADARKTLKHFSLSGEASLPFGDSGRSSRSCPNYFFYVVPNDLIGVEEIPVYAGLIYVSAGGWCEVKKNAPRLHSQKVSVPVLAKLSLKLMVRFWTMRLKENRELSPTCETVMRKLA